MHKDLHPAGGQVEEAASLNDFKTLVHQGCRVDGNPLAHLPRGMIERLLDGNGGELRFGSPQERAAGGGEPDALDFLAAPAAQTLVHRVVFTIDGEQGLALLSGLGSQEFPGHDEAFFIGQTHRFAGAHCFVGGLASGHAYDSANYKIGVRVRGNGDCAGGAAEDLDTVESYGL